MDMLSNLQQQRIMVEQLRREAAIKRINVSQAIEDIKKFISDHENEDYLLVDFLLKNRIHSEKNRLVASSESPSAVNRPPRGRDEIEDKLPPYVLLTILDSTTTRRSRHHKCHQEKNAATAAAMAAAARLMGRVKCRKSHPADYPHLF